MRQHDLSPLFSRKAGASILRRDICRRIFMRRASIATLLALLLTPASLVTPASAQAWATRTVKFILTLGPGSGTDIGGRLLADRLTRKWGQPVVIENKPGGDGIVAIAAFVGARDDHVLLFAPSSSFTAHPYLHDN